MRIVLLDPWTLSDTPKETMETMLRTRGPLATGAIYISQGHPRKGGCSRWRNNILTKYEYANTIPG
jgi:hypothetical protein